MFADCKILGANHARSTALALFGSHDPIRIPTTHKRAYFFRTHGFAFDARLLTDQQRRIVHDLELMETVHVVYDIRTGKIEKFRGPETHRIMTYKADKQRSMALEVVTASARQAFCAILLLTGFRPATEDRSPEELHALATREFGLSNHMMRRIHAAHHAAQSVSR